MWLILPWRAFTVGVFFLRGGYVTERHAITIRQAVDEFCLLCRNHDTFAVGNCERESCPLWTVRPNRSLHGKTPLDFDCEDATQEVLDALDLDYIERQLG